MPFYFQGDTWEVEITIRSHQSENVLHGISKTNFTERNGQIILNAFSFQEFGVYLIRIDVKSSDNRYLFSSDKIITVKSLGQINTTIEASSHLVLTFEDNFDELVGKDPVLF